MICWFFSGDGGIWTRVRKIRPSDIYERSGIIDLTKLPLIHVAVIRQSVRTRKFSFPCLTASHRAHPLCHARTITGRWSGWEDAISRRSAENPPLLGSERKCSVGSAIGTWFFVLIFRGRHLSARNLGPASPVEACHPQLQIHCSIGNPFLHICLYSLWGHIHFMQKYQLSDRIRYNGVNHDEIGSWYGQY